jgi:hypothetical protein
MKILGLELSERFLFPLIPLIIVRTFLNLDLLKVDESFYAKRLFLERI